MSLESDAGTKPGKLFVAPGVSPDSATGQLLSLGLGRNKHDSFELALSEMRSASCSFKLGNNLGYARR